jgi:serine/threonine-protein kinase
MGEVYLARDESLNRDVALKVLPPELDRDPQRFERFRYEAQAAGRLNHPNILTIYDIGCDQGIHYLVSELLDGETLADRIGKGPLSTKKAIDFSIQIALGGARGRFPLSPGVSHRPCPL